MHERQGKGLQHTCGGTTALDLASHDHNPPFYNDGNGRHNLDLTYFGWSVSTIQISLNWCPT